MMTRNDREGQRYWTKKIVQNLQYPPTSGLFIERLSEYHIASLILTRAKIS